MKWDSLLTGRYIAEALPGREDLLVSSTIDRSLPSNRRRWRSYTKVKHTRRKGTLDLAGEIGISMETGDYPAGALRTADEAFLSSTAGGIMPVTKIDGEALGNGKPGPISWRLRELYWSKREAGWLGTRVKDIVGVEKGRDK
jgi:hypothetical protein